MTNQERKILDILVAHEKTADPLEGPVQAVREELNITPAEALARVKDMAIRQLAVICVGSRNSAEGGDPTPLTWWEEGRAPRQAQEGRIERLVQKIIPGCKVIFEETKYIRFRICTKGLPDSDFSVILQYSGDRPTEFWESLSEDEVVERLLRLLSGESI